MTVEMCSRSSPKIAPEQAKKMLEYFGLLETDLLTITMKGTTYSLTAKEAFLRFLNISEAPSFFFFKLLQYYCSEQLYRDRIAEMSKNTLLILDYDEYYQYCLRERRNISEVLFDFKSIKIPLDIFLSFIGFVKPRSYSIASSNLKDSSKIGLLVGLVEYETYHGRNVIGTCSRFFRDLQIGQQVFLRLTKGTMEFPKDQDTPILMVGPGTGLAPFLSFCEDREVRGGMNKFKNYLFTGNRNRAKDFLRGEYLENLRDNQK